MKIGLKYRDAMSGVVLDELDSLVAGVQAGWGVEHTVSGTHGNVTATSVSVSGRVITDATGTIAFRDGTGLDTAWPTIARESATRIVVNGGIKTAGYSAGLYLEDVFYPGNTSKVHALIKSFDLVYLNEPTRGNYAAWSASTGEFNMLSGALGTGSVAGPCLNAGRNSSGSGAPGSVGLIDKGNTARYLFFDSTGALRQHTAKPTESGGDTVGSVVGTSLPSCTITGDLTVDTSTLYVDSTNNRVGIGTAAPGDNQLVVHGTSGLITLAVGDQDGTLGKRTRVGYTFTDDRGFINAYDNNAGAYKEMRVDGLPLLLNYQSGGSVGVNLTGPTRKLDVGGTIGLTEYVEFTEMSEPAAPSSNMARLYVKDNGSGKTQLCVRFATGAVQVLATEP